MIAKIFMVIDMPTKRDASCYRKVPNHLYTRKEYIKSIPQSKIKHYNIGDPNLEYDYKVMIVSEQYTMILSRSLEAMRITANRYMNETVGKGKFFLRTRPVPHHIIRERKFLGMAGADRIQKGMRRAYGKPIDRAAIVDIGDIIIEIWVKEKDLKHAKRAAKLVMHKLGIDARMEIIPFSK